MKYLPAVSRFAAWGVIYLAASAASAQTIYRCGNSYSQTPCAGALIIAVDDSRSPSQKAQTDAATTQARQLAGQMERERLALEKSAHRAKPPSLGKEAEPGKAKRKPGQQAGPSTVRQPAGTSSQKKAKEPAFFTASGSVDKKLKPGANTTD